MISSDLRTTVPFFSLGAKWKFNVLPSVPPNQIWDIRGHVLYHLKHYDDAIIALRNVRTQPLWIIAMLAAAYAQLGQLENARRELNAFLSLGPGTTLRSLAERNIYADQDMYEYWLEGLRKAGPPE